MYNISTKVIFDKHLKDVNGYLLHLAKQIGNLEYDSLDIANVRTISNTQW